MSNFRLQQPMVHLPSFKVYQVTGLFLKAEIETLGLEIPLGMLDGQYYHTDFEGWGKVLYNLTFSSGLYKKDKFDCENYALKAMNLCAERYGLNTLALVIGSIPQGRHGFNMFYFGDGFRLWEPNMGFDWSGEPFEIGEYGYQSDKVLI